MPNFEREEIVIFRGIRLDDVEKKYDAVQLAMEEAQYDKVPKKFTGIDDWPTKCNLRCWHCDLAIDGPPLFVPLTLNMQNDQLECVTEGVFNRWGCVSAYVASHYRDKKLEHTRNLVRIVAGIFIGEEIKTIPPAPDRTVMLPYGGSQTENDYLSSIPL